jgi:hypothetical protein
VEIGSGAVIYLSDFIKTGSGVQKLIVNNIYLLIGGIHRHTNTQIAM